MVVKINNKCITNGFIIIDNEIVSVGNNPINCRVNPILVDMLVKKLSIYFDNISKINEVKLVSAAGTGRMKKNCVVQAGPNESYYTTIGSVDLLESVDILSKEWSWYRIRYNVGSTGTKKIGFVLMSNVTTSDANKIPSDNFNGGYAYCSKAITIYSCDDPSYSVSSYGSLSKLEGATILLTEGSSYYREYSTSTGAKRGYAKKSDLVIPYSTCVATVKNPTDVSSGTGNSYSNLGSLGSEEFVSIIAKNDDDIYVEYNTNSGRKRGYILYSNVTTYNRPTSFNDLFTHNNKGKSGYVSSKNIVFGGPAESYASIGAVNCEDIITYSTNNSVFQMTYVEYYVTDGYGSYGKKSGYIYASNIKDMGVLEHNELTVLSDSYLYFGNKIEYGESQLKKKLTYYKAGSGNNHAFLVFAQHGWEDGKKANGQFYHGDGDMLVRIAKYFLEQFTSSGELSIEQRTKILNDWTIFVFPCNNPDGMVNGYTNNGFGRCLHNGVDPNRSWPGNFDAITDKNDKRNYTGETFLNGSELKALYDVISKNGGSDQNLVIDIHGWQNMILTRNSDIANYYLNQFKKINSGFWHKTPSNDSGYLIRWASNSETITDTNKNRKGINAKTGLLELPETDDYSLNNIEATYGLAFFRATINMLLGIL